MIQFGQKVISPVKDTGGDNKLESGMLGVVVEVNSDGTYDIYFPDAEGKLRTLSADEISEYN